MRQAIAPANITQKNYMDVLNTKSHQYLALLDFYQKNKNSGLATSSTIEISGSGTLLYIQAFPRLVVLYSSLTFSRSRWWI